MATILFCKRVNETTWINNAFATYNTFTIFAVLHFSFLLTVNRFVAFISPKYNIFFESTRLYFLITLVWLSALAITIVDFYYCTRKFLVWNMTWDGDCAKLDAGDIWWRIRYIWALFIPSAMFVMYIAIFYSIRRKQRFASNINQNRKNTEIPGTTTESKHGTRNESKHGTTNVLKHGTRKESKHGTTNVSKHGTRKESKHGTTNGSNAVKTYDYERSMLIQAAWNCGVMEIGGIIFRFLPPFLVQIFGEALEIPSNIFINCYVIFVCTILPTVYFIYNKAARNIVKEYIDHLLHLHL
ncbi:hypothetical protein X798_07065 [Onchocerca flexuosa]|uniref:G_PROTEIN_RECEP_F1_2 domain-containing protein n=1 Tax=Onchocerca flexuosa TaxID=387005 RepID=A0A238BKJ9_9BILA|nr:hypothetical protein X798_07065 [Onchocerca flexuosa]